MAHKGYGPGGYGNHGRAESVGKIAARAFAYSSIPRRDFWGKKHLVIASRRCGDIRFLLSCGVPRQHIIACDIDRVAYLSAKRLQVSALLLPIEEVVRLGSGCLQHLASINIDLCSSLVNGLPILLKVLEHVPQTYRGAIFFTFERAFDQRYGFRSTRERIRYLSERLKSINYHKSANEIIRDSFEYQSFTKTGHGSPMIMANLTLKSNRR